ncbi:unnamed protein product [Symbiodinium microadriaticum]|nr:unnamed protein product [Symbiodinium microadriaticum]
MVLLEVRGLNGPVCSIRCNGDSTGRELKEAIEKATLGRLLAVDQRLARGERILRDEDVLGEAEEESALTVVQEVAVSVSLSAAVPREAARRRWKGAFNVDEFEQLLARKRGLKCIGHETESWSDDDTARWHFWSFLLVHPCALSDRPTNRFMHEVERLEEKHRRLFGLAPAAAWFSYKERQPPRGARKEHYWTKDDSARWILVSILLDLDEEVVSREKFYELRKTLQKKFELTLVPTPDVPFHLTKEFNQMLSADPRRNLMPTQEPPTLLGHPNRVRKIAAPALLGSGLRVCAFRVWGTCA